jgi:hypothetical protein
MEASKKKLYVETTIPSVITARPSANYVALRKQQVSREFWEYERHKYDLYISELVEKECKRGDPEAAKRRLDFIEGIACLQKSKDADDLGDEYYKILGIPERAKEDCYHLAICVIENMDILLSWNLKHLGQQKTATIERYNQQHGLKTPKLCSPEMLTNVPGDIMDVPAVMESLDLMDSIDDDPVIQEVRRIKAEIMEEFDYDLKKLGAHLEAIQEEKMARGFKYATFR